MNEPYPPSTPYPSAPPDDIIPWLEDETHPFALDNFAFRFGDYETRKRRKALGFILMVMVVMGGLVLLYFLTHS